MVSLGKQGLKRQQQQRLIPYASWQAERFKLELKLLFQIKYRFKLENIV